MEILFENKTVLVATFKEPLTEPQKTLDRLGGTIKIGEVFKDTDKHEGWEEIVGDFLVQDHREGKLKFGVSLYNFSQSHEKVLKKLLKDSKKFLKEFKISSRFVNKPWKSVPNAAIAGEKLIKTQSDIFIIEQRGRFYFCNTIALQDFEAYGLRDYKKPRRNPTRGMLPPKLSQMMINLADRTTPATIYDPFCGNGTILMEAMLMGFNVVGSDISEDAVYDTIENLKWLQLTYPHTRKCTWKVFTQDITYVSKKKLETEVDAVVTESYLGPPLRKFPQEKDLKKIQTQIATLIEASFTTYKKILKPGTPIISIIPTHKEKKHYHVNQRALDSIQQQGFTLTPLLEEHTSLIYDREDQIVARMIINAKL